MKFRKQLPTSLMSVTMLCAVSVGKGHTFHLSITRISYKPNPSWSDETRFQFSMKIITMLCTATGVWSVINALANCNKVETDKICIAHNFGDKKFWKSIEFYDSNLSPIKVSTSSGHVTIVGSTYGRCWLVVKSHGCLRVFIFFLSCVSFWL